RDLQSAGDVPELVAQPARSQREDRADQEHDQDQPDRESSHRWSVWHGPRARVGSRPILGVMWLECARRCGGRLFRPLDAELVIDASGDYQEHRVVQPTYLCLNCGSPAIDLGAVPEAMAVD